MLVIKAVGFANGTPCPHVGQYLKEANFEAYGGQGWMDFTPNIKRAMKFKDLRAAMDCWETQSKTVPLRPDGRPNRPLTALTIEIEEAP